MFAAACARKSAFRDDRGFAVVVALLVTMISFILVTAVLAQAISNVTQSGYMRKRTTAIHAAEAGLSWFSHVLESTTLQSLSTSPWVYSDDWWSRTVFDVSSEPDDAEFTIRVKYASIDVCLTAPCSATGLAPFYPLAMPVPEPLYAIVRSIGTAGGVSRALESAVRLHVQTGGLDSTMGVIGTSLCFDAGASLVIAEGSVHILDTPPGQWPDYFPDSCKTSEVFVDNGNGLELQNGSLLVDDQGLKVTNGGTFKVKELWVEKAITLGGTGGNIVDECGSNTICVSGDAIGSTVTIGSGAAVLGDLVECDPACPPTPSSFPILTADAAAWTNWTIVNVATSAAALMAIPYANTKTAYIISSNSPGSCNTLFSGTYTINVDVAIVSSCKFDIKGNTQDKFIGSGSLTLVSAWPGTAAAPGSQPVCTGGTRDISMSGNPSPDQPVFFYTPCSLIINNSQDVVGQFVARFIWLKNPNELSIVNLIGDAASVPGLVSGFKQDIRYVKEILPTDALLT